MLAVLRKQAKEAGQDPEKVALDPWQVRDLRRTERTLMSRARIDTEISERALGHVMTQVRGTYDRYKYLAEKRDAFERLASLIERIVKRIIWRARCARRYRDRAARFAHRVGGQSGDACGARIGWATMFPNRLIACVQGQPQRVSTMKSVPLPVSEPSPLSETISEAPGDIN
jgi:hypothetical protein